MMEEIYDKKAPQTLIDLQEWFGAVITQPIDSEDKINSRAPSGAPIEVDACAHLTKSAKLEAYEHIEIYNQQYWWRLLRVLRSNFPMTVRLLGAKEFDRLIAIPHMQAHPPDHWYLNYLGAGLAAWTAENYQGKHAALIHDATAIDWAYVHSYFAGEYPIEPLMEAVKNSAGDHIAKETLTLQPHLHLLHFRRSIPKLRDLLLEEGQNSWVNKPLPPFDQESDSYYVIYRNGLNDVVWTEVEPSAFRLLSQFRHGTSLENICTWIESQEESLIADAYKNLHAWFQNWTIRRWLGQKLC